MEGLASVTWLMGDECGGERAECYRRTRKTDDEWRQRAVGGTIYISAKRHASAGNEAEINTRG